MADQTRYGAGIYTIINDDGNTRNIMVDNKRITCYRKTMLTVNVKNNMHHDTSLIETNVFAVYYIGDQYDSVIGNVSNQV